LELARRVGDRVWEAQLYVGSLSTHVLTGSWDEAVSRSVQYDEVDALLTERILLVPLVEIHRARGELDEARAVFARLADAPESTDVQVQAGYRHACAQIWLAEQRPADALHAAREAIALRDELGVTSLLIKLAMIDALEAASTLGDEQEVRQLLDDIDALRPGERPRLLDAHTHRFRAKLEGGEAGFTAAEALFRELATPFYLGVTLLEHGELLAEEGRGDDAEPLLAEARELFAQLRATPWLERAGGRAAAEPGPVETVPA
jgi:tetratricopeptide (TPR) repeat protein